MAHLARPERAQTDGGHMAETALIERAEHPVVAFGKQLGRDEIYAAVLSAVLTAVAYWLLDLATEGEPSTALMAAVLPWVGPLLEKPGLVAHYVGEAVVAKKAEGGPLWGHLKRALTDGRAWKTVRADILFHDPAYTALMALGVVLFQPDGSAAVGFLAVLSFFGAVLVAALLEVSLVEHGYRRLARRLSGLGFAREGYWETRYLIVADDPRHSPEAVLEKLAARFGLADRMVLRYEDVYYGSAGLPGFNGRGGQLRMRSVWADDGAHLEPERRTLQVVYTRAAELGRDEPSLFRCFAVCKDKHAMPVPFGAEPPRPVLRAFRPVEERKVVFWRHVARDPAGLLVTVDVMSRDGGSPSTYWIEAKVRSDLELLRAANEFIAMHFPVRGTTKGKRSLVEDMEEFRLSEAAG